MAPRHDLDPRLGSFDDYFRAYLAERQNPWTRRAQLATTSLGVGLVATSFVGAAAASLAPAWLGQRLFERNRPRGVKNLAWRLRADLLLWTEALHKFLGGSDLRSLRVVESVASRVVEAWPEPVPEGDGFEVGASTEPDTSPRAAVPPPPSPAASRDWAVWQ